MVVEGVFSEYAVVVDLTGQQLNTVRESHVAVAAEKKRVVQTVGRNGHDTKPQVQPKGLPRGRIVR